MSTSNSGITQRALIALTGISKSYRRGTQSVSVLDNVDLEIPAGSFDAIMGPSGSGKTTLLNLMSGIDQATAGRVEVAGVDITHQSEDDLAEWRLRHIGFVFQFYNLVQVLTAFQNVELPLLLARLPAHERRKRVETALELVGLRDRMDHLPRQLSGGQEQRVGIARAIVTDPTIIVADEPTGDLDRESAAHVLQVLGRLNRELGKTIVMVTHDPEAARAARIVHHIDKGKLLARPPAASMEREHTAAG
jgi:putative ABC transport system ATP-binding protein